MGTNFGFKQSPKNPLFDKIAISKKNESALEPKDDKARIGFSEQNQKNFDASQTWPGYEQEVKTLMNNKYHFDFARKWDHKVLDALRKMFESRTDPDVAARSLSL